MIEIGRLCVKIAGRDAGSKCVVVDTIDKKSVLIDGETRRRKCNISHLEPLAEVIKIKKGASHADISKEFKKLGFEARETKPKKAAEKPKKAKKKIKEPKEASKEKHKEAHKETQHKKEAKKDIKEKKEHKKQ